MEIIAFSREHLEEAKKLACSNYEEERNILSFLPETADMDLNPLAENSFGTAAVEDNRLLGFLCFYPPVDNMWGTTNQKGAFSPLFAHGAVKMNREAVYDRLYQKTAECLVACGIGIHAVALYEHDQDAVKSFYQNGFGIRCVDAMKKLSTPVQRIQNADFYIREAERKEWPTLFPLIDKLSEHEAESPYFMALPFSDRRILMAEQARYFVLFSREKAVAYLKLSKEAETFCSADPSVMNICGAYCLSEYRSRGLYQELLFFVEEQLYREGYQLLGVDYESFNPNARHFWPKYFAPYTKGVVRRIDESVLTGRI